MSKIDNVITDVLTKEGGGKVSNDSADKGGRTQYGISETANPSAWKDGSVSEKEAREIYLQKYVIGTGYVKIPPSHGKVQAQLIDFGVHSGPAIATMKLQSLLGVAVDGVLGPKTLAALAKTEPREINNKLVLARAEMICRLVTKQPSQLRFLWGWLNRTLSFYY